MSDVRDPRPETGPMVFAGDWPGVFIRGDNANGYANVLRSVIESHPEYVADLGALLLLLQSCESGRPKLMPIQRLHEFKTALAGQRPTLHVWLWDTDGNPWTLESLAAVTRLKPKSAKQVGREEEVVQVEALLRHPAAYDVDLFGVLSIRTTDQETVEVEWEHRPDESGRTNSHVSFPKTALNEAVRFFVNKRHEMELGADIEGELFRASREKP